MRPSTAPLAMPIEACDAKPCATATVEGQLRVFEVPWTVFQTVQNGLGFLFPGR